MSLSPARFYRKPQLVTAKPFAKLNWPWILLLIATIVLSSIWFANKAQAIASGQPVLIDKKTVVQQANNRQPEAGSALGAIAGIIKATDSDQPLPDEVRVNIYGENNAIIATEVVTANTGIYRVESLLPGSYKVHFKPTALNSRYLEEYYNGAYELGNATLVTVIDGQTTPNINASLERGGLISGTVTAEGSGLPLPGVRVVAESEDYTKFAITDQNGRYQISPLIADTYVVDFSQQGAQPIAYFEEYYNNKQNDLEADKIAIAFGSVFPNLDAALTPAGTIKGRVTASDSNAGIPEVKVRAFGSGTPINTITDASGYYTLTPLLPYSYTIQFSATNTNNGISYLGEYYNDQPSALTADKVIVSIITPTIENINAVLTPSGQISGKVIAADSQLPLKNVQVLAQGTNCQPQVLGRTDASGVYTLTGLATGGYRIYFDALTFISPQGYISEYYDNQQTLLAAKIVTLTVPGKVENINAELDKGAQIAGRLQDANGQPINNVVVTIIGQNGNTTVQTDATGYYTSTALPSGDYLVSFVATGQGYISQYYNGKLTLATADTITLQAPQILANINSTLQQGSQFSGTVTYANNNPVTSGRVAVYDAVSGHEVAIGTTNVAGRYITSPGLPTGSYILRFSPNSAGSATYAYVYHNQKNTLTSADPVAVTAPNATVINAVLQPGGTISGSLALSNSGQIFPGDALIEVFDSAGQLVDSVDYDPTTGHYRTSALPTGSYRVHFRPIDVTDRCVDVIDYAKVYYKNQLSLASATPVNLTAPTNVAGINQAIYLFGQVPQQPIALSAVTITGPASGVTTLQHSFTANLTPADATTPFTYTWQATEQNTLVNTSQEVNNTVKFTWSTGGAKTVTVQVDNGVSTVQQSLTVTITRTADPKVFLPSVYGDK